MFPPAGGLEDYAENATVGLLNYHTIKNGFYLGHTEFRDLAGPVDWQQLADLGVTNAVLKFVCTQRKMSQGLSVLWWIFSTCRINSVLDHTTVLEPSSVYIGNLSILTEAKVCAC